MAQKVLAVRPGRQDVMALKSSSVINLKDRHPDVRLEGSQVAHLNILAKLVLLEVYLDGMIAIYLVTWSPVLFFVNKHACTPSHPVID